MSRAAAITAVKAFFRGYFHALWFAVWSAFVLIVGVSIGVAVALSALEMHGIPVTREFAKWAGIL